ncbi:protein YgfX [Nitrosomonas eutropha]|uniref:protein YgfX n=1 Tax=Nitrosomonas eutropha TaxID=916 RepID=UPI000944418A|nr:protein YgfX [Nitrosomonas eutropha]
MNALSIQLQPSRQLAMLLSLAHCTAAGVFWPLALPVVVKIMITLLLAGSLYYYLQRYARLAFPQSIMTLHLTGRNHCKIETCAGKSINTVIDASTFVAPYMTVLCLKMEQTYRYRTVVILPDSIDADSFRRLRVWLKWKWRDESK